MTWNHLNGLPGNATFRDEVFLNIINLTDIQQSVSKYENKLQRLQKNRQS